MNGDRILIDDARKHINDLAKPDAPWLESFHRTTDFSESNSAKTQADRDKVFAKLQNVLKLQWGFMDGDLEMPTDLSTPPPGAYGLTTINLDYINSSNDPSRFWRIFIWLDIDMVFPLVRKDPFHVPHDIFQSSRSNLLYLRRPVLSF